MTFNNQTKYFMQGILQSIKECSEEEPKNCVTEERMSIAKEASGTMAKTLVQQGTKIDSEDAKNMYKVCLDMLQGQSQSVKYLIEKTKVNVLLFQKLSDGKTFYDKFAHEIWLACMNLYSMHVREFPAESLTETRHHEYLQSQSSSFLLECYADIVTILIKHNVSNCQEQSLENYWERKSEDAKKVLKPFFDCLREATSLIQEEKDHVVTSAGFKK